MAAVGPKEKVNYLRLQFKKVSADYVVYNDIPVLWVTSRTLAYIDYRVASIGYIILP